MFLFTYISMQHIIPFLDIAWGIFTLLQYRVNSYAELAAYRFLVGWFEVSSIHYYLRSYLMRKRLLSFRQCTLYLVS